MSTKLNWEGIYLVVLTPFTKDGEIDFDMFAKHRSPIKAGSTRYYPCRYIRRSQVLWKQKKKFELLKFAKTITDSRIPGYS